MPANERSLRITDVYRDRLQGLVNRVAVPARALWQEHIDFDNLNASYEPVQARTADLIARSQRQAVQLTAAYFAGFVGLEQARIIPVPGVDSAQYVGQSFGSKVLVDSLRSPLVATLVAIEEQKKEPLAIGLRTLMANIDLDVKAAGRRALLDLIADDERVEGWQRAIRGTCAACAASPPHGDSMPVHPHCQCVPEPKVRGAHDNFPRATGSQLFDDLSPSEQDDAIGQAAAEKIRAGEATLAAFIEVDGPFLRQRPIKDLQ